MVNDSNSNDDDTISHDNTICHNDANDSCTLKEDIISHIVKCIKEHQNVKNDFLNKISDTERKKKNMRKKNKKKEKNMMTKSAGKTKTYFWKMKSEREIKS